MHAITVPKDAARLRENIPDMAALCVAVGPDPKKSILFVQSDVPGHAEPAWIPMCNAYTGELFRMTQFKEKSGGNDQKQHIEICRDIAIRVDNKYGAVFVVPDGRA
jgi:tryptophanyl-tRNA synthetase